jgi:hypothetical protein
MLSITPSDASIAAAAPVAVDDVFVLHGWNTAFGGIDRVKSEMAADQMRRAGVAILENRGAIVDDQFSGFIGGYALRSEDKSKARKDARDRKAERWEEEFGELTKGERDIKIQELAEAKAKRKADRDAADAARYKDIYDRICLGFGKAEKHYTQDDADWYNAYERRQQKLGGKTFQEALAEAKPSDLLFRYAQSSEDRIRNGYEWLGGLVAGKYWQDRIVFPGLKSDEHWLLKRFPAATAKASSGELRAGPTKDGCKPIYRRIIAHDEPYIFFGERCKDMFRVDRTAGSATPVSCAAGSPRSSARASWRSCRTSWFGSATTAVPASGIRTCTSCSRKVTRSGTTKTITAS